mmetsp:Transcript_124053/g.362106  ORF Transcript_124053/g.362106 Transcript_124053/m.362106 type:complete len:223 (+) Transcript_124053:56-724(+)
MASDGHNGGRWGPGELKKRGAVLAALVAGLAVPMWIWPLYCDIVLWAFLLGGATEWWVAAYGRGDARLQDVPWLAAAFLLWVVPTTVMVAQYKEVVGHRRMVQCVLIQLAIGDTAQLLCGRFLGRHFVCGRLSPKKTLEGYLGGAVVTCAYGAAVHSWRTNDILLVYLAGCAGDLYFSSVKRQIGLKDFSHLLSSHGGLLDRIDSFVFASNLLFWTSSAVVH